MLAEIEEIFTSIQGEGPWIGQRHIFVRFRGCNLRCRYCDTWAAASSHDRNTSFCRIQNSPGSLDFQNASPEISLAQLTKYCSQLCIEGPAKPVISLTGGEPLLHLNFLAKWLPEIKNVFTIYLETNGTQDAAMKKLSSLIDIVSMDFKLPSATGLQSLWDEHEKFLSAARGTSLFVKAVVTSDTLEKEIMRAASLIAAFDRAVPFIIQPASGPLRPEPGLLMKFQNAALAELLDVRIIPQVHKMLQVP